MGYLELSNHKRIKQDRKEMKEPIALIVKKRESLTTIKGSLFYV